MTRAPHPGGRWGSRRVAGLGVGDVAGAQPEVGQHGQVVLKTLLQLAALGLEPEELLGSLLALVVAVTHTRKVRDELLDAGDPAVQATLDVLELFFDHEADVSGVEVVTDLEECLISWLISVSHLFTHGTSPLLTVSDLLTLPLF